MIVAAGNDLNRKLSFWVNVTNDEAANDLRRIEEEHLFDNKFDDVPSEFIEPKVSISGLLNYKLVSRVY